MWSRTSAEHQAPGQLIVWPCSSLRDIFPAFAHPCPAGDPELPWSRRRRLPGYPPRLTILPKRWGPEAVGQFQRRFRNCHLHSRTALCSPPLTLCRMPGFWRISRRCLRLSSCRLGSSTSCRLLESVRRFVEEATFTMPLVRRMIRLCKGDLYPHQKGRAHPAASLELFVWKEWREVNNKVMTLLSWAR